MSTLTDVPAERATEDGADHTRRRLGLVRERRLAVDRVACSGHGVCAQLLAGVTLDEWGYRSSRTTASSVTTAGRRPTRR